MRTMAALIIIYLVIAALCFLTPYTHQSRNKVLASYEVFVENFYPANQYWRASNNVYAKGVYTIQTTDHNNVLSTNKYLLIDLSESSTLSQTNIVDILPTNAIPIDEKGFPPGSIKNGGSRRNGPPSNTQLKEIAAKIPDEVFAIWFNIGINLYIIDNRDKEDPKLFTPNYYYGRVFESENRSKNLWKAVAIANIEDYILAPYNTGYIFLLAFCLRGLSGING